ncbi:uncharacterized protein LOC110007598 [Amborella trichopoda]|uniref:uncharacterized protein LOC110007598 n=1 Tax=Amborella trichopoda TaxID=13333 RepID=UPI0009BD9B9E|nr:uncharacterized protein LOC110007598 [Amborella trichopoda]|eukprot:XP_020525220.1 uncharacterized protein LOC110007598 [Amborella trichopoda]
MFGSVFQASSEETPDQQKNLIKKVRADREHELLLAGSLEAKNAADANTERCSIFYINSVNLCEVLDVMALSHSYQNRTRLPYRGLPPFKLSEKVISVMQISLSENFLMADV